jgi:hypothetical protein
MKPKVIPTSKRSSNQLEQRTLLVPAWFSTQRIQHQDRVCVSASGSDFRRHPDSLHELLWCRAGTLRRIGMSLDDHLSPAISSRSQ